MIWLLGFVMLAFYGLAICTIGGMLANGINPGFAIAAGVLQTIVGVCTVRVLYHNTY